MNNKDKGTGGDILEILMVLHSCKRKFVCLLWKLHAASTSTYCEATLASCAKM